MSVLKRTPVFLTLLILLALLLRWPHIGDSFYGDEHFSLLRDSSHLVPVSEDRFRPIFFSLLFLWRQIGFHGEIGLRLLPLLFGLAQIPVAYFVGRRLGGERLARVFALLIAVSPMLIEFSQELRMYSMVAFIALLQVLAVLRAVEKPTLARWAIFSLVGLVGVYTHLHYWLFLVCFALTFYRLRRTVSLYRGMVALIPIVVLYLPNIPNVTRFSEVRAGTYSVHLPSAIPKLLTAFTVGFNYFELPEQSLGRAIGFSDVMRNLPLALLVLIPALILLVGFVGLHLKKPRDPVLLLSHELFTIPILLALIATVVSHQYWLQPKYLIFSVPFALLLIAQSYLSLDNTFIRRSAAVCAAAICIVALFHFWNPLDYGRRENWIGLTNKLKSEITNISSLVLLPDSYGLLRYYWPEAPQHWQKVNIPLPKSPSPDYTSELRQSLEGKSDVFYIRWDTVQNEMDPRDVLIQSLDQIGTRDRVIQFNPRFFLYHWQLGRS